MKKLALAAVVFFTGCAHECGTCGENNKPQQAAVVQQPANPASSFQDEHYVWESWTYGTNKVEKTK